MNTRKKERVSGPVVGDVLKTISPAVKVGDTIFCSGQIAIDATTGKFKSESVTEEVHQVMKNLKDIVEAAGGSLNDIVKTTVFLTSMEDFPRVNEIYGTYFTGIPPARSTIQVAGLFRGLRVEIEAVAVIGSG